MFLFPSGPDHNECKWSSGGELFSYSLIDVLLKHMFLCAFKNETFQTFVGCFGHVENTKFHTDFDTISKKNKTSSDQISVRSLLFLLWDSQPVKVPKCQLQSSLYGSGHEFLQMFGSLFL